MHQCILRFEFKLWFSHADARFWIKVDTYKRQQMFFASAHLKRTRICMFRTRKNNTTSSKNESNIQQMSYIIYVHSRIVHVRNRRPRNTPGVQPGTKSTSKQTSKKRHRSPFDALLRVFSRENGENHYSSSNTAADKCRTMGERGRTPLSKSCGFSADALKL